MSIAKILECPHCGGEVGVASATSLIVTCDHCGTLLRRRDVNLEEIERVGWVLPLGSQFQQGTTGTYRDVAFTVRGQIQLDHGAGRWNEWAAECADGKWIWIAEAQGELAVFEEIELDGKDRTALMELAERFPAGLSDGQEPAKGELLAGDSLKLSGQSWMVTEIGTGRVVTCAGELPIDPAVGSETRYVDLGKGQSRVATVDITRGEPEFFSGERVPLASLRLDPGSQPEHTPERVVAARLRCPNCDGQLEVQDPEHAQRIGCMHCDHILERKQASEESGALGALGALSSRDQEPELVFQTLVAQKKVKARSPLRLGATGELLGETLTVLGAMERRVNSFGRWYPWREVLLRNAQGGYRWLVENKGHWLFTRPLAPSGVSSNRQRATFEGRRHKHFSGGEASVHWVVGEFYWRVEAGESTQADDYVDVRGGRAVSVERSATEAVASESVRVSPDELRAAFGLKHLPAPVGVGMLDPNPADPRGTLKILGMLVAALIVGRIFFGSTHANRTVYTADLGPTPSAADKEKVDFSEPFELERGPANLLVRLETPGINQGWIGLNGALVSLDSGQVTTFATQAQHYSGSSGGESWSEGKRRGSTWLGSIPAGTYRLRLAAQGAGRGLGHSYRVSVRSQVPRFLWFFLALIPMGVALIISGFRSFNFEATRWADSDHPWSESE